MTHVPEAETFVAECFWPDVKESDLKALDRRVERAAADLEPGRKLRYLGSILLREDEVVLCQFEGAADAVRDVAERARVPFERILAASHSPWPPAATRRSRRES
jgi:hypothetical protein